MRDLATLARALKRATSPAERYRHARLLHGVRVALAMLTSIVLTSGIDIPHGIWASVSMLVVIGGLQHQGGIRQKAFERAVGTAIGAGLGLLWVAQFSLIGSTPLMYALLSITAGVCGYHAIGKGGYIALLTAITMCIVAGHGEDSIEIGLWRTANVLIGIGIALVFSFALPLRATYSWRHGLALNLRRCAGVLKRLGGGRRMTAEEQLAVFGDLGTRLVSLRALMPSVAKESGVPLGTLEEVQRGQRAFLSALEMLASAPRLEGGAAVDQRVRDIRATLLRTARRLRSTAPTAFVAPARSEPAAPGDPRGPDWVLDHMAGQATRLSRLLANPRLSGSAGLD